MDGEIWPEYPLLVALLELVSALSSSTRLFPPTPPETLGADNKNSDGGNDLLLKILTGEMTEMQVLGSLSEGSRRSRDLELSQQISLLELFQLWAGRCWQCRGTFWCEIART